jgi:signal transduction histidine kinase
VALPRALGAESALVGSVASFSCFGVWAELHYATGPVPWAPGAYLLTLGAAVPLLWRRERPVATSVLCLLCVAGYHVARYPGLAPAVLVFLACAALGAYARRYGLLLGLLAAALVWTLLALPPNRLPFYALDVSMPAIAYGASAVVGSSMRRRRLEHEARLREEAAAAEERLGRMLAEERLRIARELHDVLAHTISVMAVQSTVALDALDSAPLDPAGAREAMLLVRGAARQAMPELRAALDLLRGTTGAPDPAPQPGLGQLPELVAQIRDSGLEVQLSVGEDAERLPPLVQLTAYRIVQEALTNALRHAAARRAMVSLTHHDGRLVVEVTDDGRGAAQTGVPGFGLLGMKERVEALGGRVDVGPGPAGGFLVRAELPGEAG